MMEKDFRGMRTARKRALLLTLLAWVAGVSSPLIAAEIRQMRVGATDAGTRVVLELSGPVKHKAFLLDDPGRVVLDVSGAKLLARHPDFDAPITKFRSGRLPHGGVRLVFEVDEPVSISTSTLAASAQGPERLVLDINTPGTATAAAAAPAAPVSAARSSCDNPAMPCGRAR
jgi:N-acetylmuramoyl-L-alanine amidase